MLPPKKEFSKRSHDDGVKIVLFFVLFRSSFKKVLRLMLSSIVTNQSQKTSNVMFVYLSREKKKFRQKCFAPQSFQICIWKRLCYPTLSPLPPKQLLRLLFTWKCFLRIAQKRMTSHKNDFFGKIWTLRFKLKLV